MTILSQLDPALSHHLAALARESAQLSGSLVARRRLMSDAVAAYAVRNAVPALRMDGVRSENDSVVAAGRRIGTRTYRATAGVRSDLTLVYFHGGGFVSGGLDSHDDLLRRITSRLGCTVLGVDYRLAPEHVFPTALDDALEVLRHVRARLGTEGRLALGGDSSGGHLAASAAYLEARDAAGLFLVYPVVKPGYISRSAVQRSAAGLTTDMMQWFWEQYLGRPVTADAPATNDPRIDLLLQRWPQPPPPAVVLTAWHDPLCDEGEAYARHLNACGGRATLLCAEDMPHGFARHGSISHTADAHLARALDTFALHLEPHKEMT